ncbi:holo-[acyl-carrier protein] synthase [Persephonella hydrogeniphila]|uniref:Holo-[acyl-carrier-protein] synthase n=1 Tax=Persephonella hydrogeniphila TaxID=198703 RepID=A0A285NFZ6_9AQUI|nr:holo-ACP synthase [Persephonella hydrogeniphila]SNZ08432.1 holo-[acyl-carrier protein] synthase [Persephonella hydrogeniphila]
MQIYTGIDIVENNRIKKAVEKHGDRFLKRVFTEDEIDYCSKKADSIPCLAARFAVKEAFIKAFSQAFGINLPLKSIEIKGFHRKHAEILLHPPDAKTRSYLTRMKYTFSLSHEKNYSVASVIIYID